MKRFAANAALLLAAFAGAFGVGEIAVRTLLAETTALFPRYQTAFQYGPYRLRGNRPGESFRHTSYDGSWRFVVNSRGFRNDREFAYEKPPGTQRVLALGDSHTHGFEVRQEATFAAVLERHLSGGGKKAEVLNTGVAGYGTAEQLAFLENEGHRYRPDVVVLGFFGNDFEDNFKSGLFRLDAKLELAAASFEHLPGVRIQDFIYAIPGVKWLGENSWFYSRLFNDVWVRFKLRLAHRTAAGDRSPPTQEGFAVPTKQEHSAEEVALAAALVERMKRFCDARGIRLVVVDIPKYVDRYRFATSMPPGFRDRLSAAGIEMIDSEALLGPYAGKVEVHLPHGWHHVSEFTHALIGVEVGRRLLGATSAQGKDQPRQ